MESKLWLGNAMRAVDTKRTLYAGYDDARCFEIGMDENIAALIKGNHIYNLSCRTLCPASRWESDGSQFTNDGIAYLMRIYPIIVI